MTVDDKRMALTLTKREAKRLERQQRKQQQRATEKPRQGFLARLKAQHEESLTKPGPKGWKRAAGGPVGYIEAPYEIQGTTVQVCGYYPFSVGAGMPVIGTPLGYHLMNRSLVCADPISWFLHGIVSNPSAFILGQPGLGKTSLVHRWIAVLADWGVIPMVLADSRPDYVRTIRELDGQVITFSPGQGHINPLDLGPLVRKMNTLGDAADREQAVAEMSQRRKSLITGLVAMFLERGLRPHERTLIAQALAALDPDLQHPPVLHDLIGYIQSRPELLRKATLTYDDTVEYDARVRDVLDALIALGPDGMYGDMFSEPTSEHITPGKPVVFDISGINENDHLLMGAVQSLCWNLGSAAVSAEQYIAADQGRPRRTYFLVMDELWRILRASDDMVYFIDSITRLNRGRGMAQVMITHTMNDLKLKSEHLTETAWGFVERSALVLLGGLSEGEMGNLEEVFNLSQAEISTLSDWTGEAPVDQWTGKAGMRPGAGNFLLKTGKESGIPFHVQLVDAEKETTNTNRDWQMVE
jgi:hypothetical protein